MTTKEMLNSAGAAAIIMAIYCGLLYGVLCFMLWEWVTLDPMIWRLVIVGYLVGWFLIWRDMNKTF